MRRELHLFFIPVILTLAMINFAMAEEFQEKVLNLTKLSIKVNIDKAGKSDPDDSNEYRIKFKVNDQLLVSKRAQAKRGESAHLFNLVVFAPDSFLDKTIVSGVVEELDPMIGLNPWVDPVIVPDGNDDLFKFEEPLNFKKSYDRVESSIYYDVFSLSLSKSKARLTVEEFSEYYIQKLKETDNLRYCEAMRILRAIIMELDDFSNGEKLQLLKKISSKSKRSVLSNICKKK
jgi:hypothetical protein